MYELIDHDICEENVKLGKVLNKSFFPDQKAIDIYNEYFSSLGSDDNSPIWKLFDGILTVLKRYKHPWPQKLMGLLMAVCFLIDENPETDNTTKRLQIECVMCVLDNYRLYYLGAAAKENPNLINHEDVTIN